MVAEEKVTVSWARRLTQDVVDGLWRIVLAAPTAANLVALLPGRLCQL
jgi:hypothetical protein